MKTVLVQYPSTTDRACGVWWVTDQGDLQSVYTAPSPEVTAARVLAIAYLAQKTPETSFEDLFRQAADRMPRSVVYEVTQTDDPAALLARLQSES